MIPNIDNIFVKNVNKNIVNNDYNNFNNFNNEEYKEEIPFQEKEPIQAKFEEKFEEKFKEKEDFGVINEDYIKSLMNYDVHDVEDILNLNNKINSGNDELFNINSNLDSNHQEINQKYNFNNN